MYIIHDMKQQTGMLVLNSVLTICALTAVHLRYHLSVVAITSEPEPHGCINVAV